MVTAMGVSVGLTAAAILGKGTTRQKERWALDLLTLDKIGAWAITEPGSGSDAFGSMKATARRSGDGYVLNGNKTFITNGPYADTIVFICKLEEAGVEPRDRKILNFVLDKGMPGLVQSKPMRKMGLHSSPTGELFLTDVQVGARSSARRERGARSGRRSRRREGDLPDRAHRRRGDGARDDRTLPRAVARLRQGARAVRQARSASSSSSRRRSRAWKSRG